MEVFVESPCAQLDGKVPCPYAREARLKRAIRFVVCRSVDVVARIAAEAESFGAYPEEIAVLIFPDPASVSPPDLRLGVARLRHEFARRDVYIMTDHPHDPEVVAGVRFNQGTFLLAMVQKLSALVRASEKLKGEGYYSGWPHDYFDEVVGFRLKLALENNLVRGPA